MKSLFRINGVVLPRKSFKKYIFNIKGFEEIEQKTKELIAENMSNKNKKLKPKDNSNSEVSRPVVKNFTRPIHFLS